MELVSTHSRPKAAGHSTPLIIIRPLFQHTAARRRLANFCCIGKRLSRFQHTAARRRLATAKIVSKTTIMFQHTAARRRLAMVLLGLYPYLVEFQHTAARRRLGFIFYLQTKNLKFQHTAARRRLGRNIPDHSPPYRCFNTQPPEGGWYIQALFDIINGVSTHSRPKAAGSVVVRASAWQSLFQHTAARRRLDRQERNWKPCRELFQHTAARRRLDLQEVNILLNTGVSTHSRPKAAGQRGVFEHLPNHVSTHSRPKAAGLVFRQSVGRLKFQHTAARRRLALSKSRLLRQA